MQSARLRIYGLLAGAALGLALALFLTAGAAQAAPAAVPGNGNGNGNGHGNSQAAGQGQGQQGGGPAVVWATGQVSTTLATGASLDTTATFTVTRALSNLRVRLTGNVRGVVTVTPSTFARVVPGQTYSVHIHLAVPAHTHRGAYVTNLQLRQGARNIGKALKVRVRVPGVPGDDAGD